VEGHGGQSTEPAGQNGHRQQALPLAGQALQQPGVVACVQPLETRLITGSRHFLAGW
jgi:hypothetical protein